MGTIDDDISGRPPADGRVATATDTSPINAGLQIGVDGSGVIVANDHDRRSLVWPREQVGDATVEAAVAQFAGQRRPYVSNVAKALGIAIPSDLTLTSADTAQARIAALHSPIEKK